MGQMGSPCAPLTAGASAVHLGSSQAKRLMVPRMRPAGWSGGAGAAAGVSGGPQRESGQRGGRTRSQMARRSLRRGHRGGGGRQRWRLTGGALPASTCPTSTTHGAVGNARLAGPKHACGMPQYAARGTRSRSELRRCLVRLMRCCGIRTARLLQLSCKVHIPFDLGNLTAALLCKAQWPGAVDETAETLR